MSAWALLARFLARRSVSDWLIRRAMRTPYTHIADDSGQIVYMEHYWLFNPYPPFSSGKRTGLRSWLPSIRLHKILIRDQDRDLHDHPWNARTVILRGGSKEAPPSGIR